MPETQHTALIPVRSSTDLAQLQELAQILTGEKDVPEIVDDPETIQREIMAQLLSAETDDELEQFGTATGWRDLEGVPMELHGFRWRPSDYDEGAPVYFVVFATRADTGERIVLTTGSANVLAQLINMAARGTLAGAVRYIEKSDRPTKQGFHPYWLRTPQAEKDRRREAAGDRDGGDS